MKLISYVHCAQEGQAQRDFRGTKSGMVLEQNEAGASITSAYTHVTVHIYTQLGGRKMGSFKPEK